MKILSISHNYNNKSDLLYPKTYNIDNFNNTVSFRALHADVFQKTADKIMNDPNLSKKLAAFLTSGFIALKAFADGKKNEEAVAENTVKSFITNAAENKTNIEEIIKNESSDTDTPDTEIKETLTVQETKTEPKQEVEAKPEQKTAENTPDKEDVIIKNTENELSHKNGIILPLRRGVLSVDEKGLKNIAAQLPKISEESESHLKEIWNLIITKGLTSDERKNIDSKALDKLKEKYNKLASSITKDLSENLDNGKKAEEIIEIQYNLIFSQNIEEKDIEKNEEQIYKTEVPQLKGVTQKGQIPLDVLEKMDKNKKKRFRTIDPDEDFEMATSVSFDEGIHDAMSFNIPGTLDANVRNNLLRLLKRFKKEYANKYNNSKIRWKKKDPATHLTRSIVINEIADASKNYMNINTTKAEFIANAINNIPEMKMFTIHGALRFVDRYVEFMEFDGTPRYDYENQIKNLLAHFKYILQKSMKEGLIIFPNKERGFVSPNVLIDLTRSKSKSASLFGSYYITLDIVQDRSKENSVLINTIITGRKTGEK